MLAGEQFKVEFRRLRAGTFYNDLTEDEWREINDLDLAEKEFARRIVEREFRHRQD